MDPGRVAARRATDTISSPVMIWTLAHLTGPVRRHGHPVNTDGYSDHVTTRPRERLTASGRRCGRLEHDPDPAKRPRVSRHALAITLDRKDVPVGVLEPGHFATAGAR